MSRSAFPGIKVNAVTLQRGKSNITRQYQVPILGTEFDPGKRIRQIEKQYEDRLISYPRTAIRYDLSVVGATRSSAAAKARAFTRIKNIFEPDVISVNSVKLTGHGKIGKQYQIETEVTKTW